MMRKFRNLFFGAIFGLTLAGCARTSYDMLEGTVLEEMRTDKREYLLRVDTSKGIYNLQIEDMGDRTGGEAGNVSASVLDAAIDIGTRISFPLRRESNTSSNFDYFKNGNFGIVDPDLVNIVKPANKE